ncbi:MAG: DUF4476 domain-containing protein, partial [Bacteroidia bacterium]
MKRYFFSILCGFFLVPAFSQVVNNLVVFANDGEAFTLIMNGERYNETPQTRVRVTGLTLKQYQVKLIFKNPKMKDHDTKLTFFSTGTECEFALNKKGKRKHTMDYFTEKPMEGYGQPQSNVQNNVQTNTVQNTGAPSDGTYTVIPTQTMTSTDVNTVTASPGIIPANQSGNPISVNTNEGSININVGNEQFQLFKSDVIKQVSDAAKQAKAIALLKNNLLSTSQVKEAMGLFSTERGKLDFVKKAYHHTKDRENYYMIVDAFPDQAAKDE